MQELAAKLSDRFGGASAFFCNSGAEAVEAAIKWARKATGRAGPRRARELVPRAHGRRALDHRATCEARGVRAAAARRALRDALDTLADAVAEETAAIVLEPVQGEGGVHPLPPGRSPRPASSPTSTARCSSSTRSRPASAAVASSSPGSKARRQAGRGHAREGPRERPADRRPARLRRRSRRLRARRSRVDLRRQPRLCAAACAVVDTLDDALLSHVRSVGAELAAGLAPLRRGARPRPAARRRARPPGRPGRRCGPRPGPGRRHGRRAHAAVRAAARRSRPTRPHRQSTSSRRCLA